MTKKKYPSVRSICALTILEREKNSLRFSLSDNREAATTVLSTGRGLEKQQLLCLPGPHLSSFPFRIPSKRRLQ